MRVLALTGQRVEPGGIQLGWTTQTATVAVSDLWFQLRGRELCLVRPCVHCGAGRFESAAIHDLVDLGHALAVWEPCCESGASTTKVVPALITVWTKALHSDRTTASDTA